ncbi:PREDICTED: RNA polymerase sigma factor sigD, chloroplastic isoform X1 [Erythranthe guttata]|uniref:RNA polymerase sigma factor sigD, chloroplastic isoform X1 n=1 Tax=Erythranthe guttata TaxID=4155 RepID=UPI00064D823E|nr:PREDICTED: RNA polymerase sigma factor sigD, chloroplastic isoform X1 [Erythranthe guttata]|eukprot:XP_012849779.1 PREDICTED: RNA polymerase sigma factor sigD, chloroplastic isoform X1 [Erythranthe guttata]
MQTPLMAICSSSNLFFSSIHSTTTNSSYLKLISIYNLSNNPLLYSSPHSSSNYACVTVREEEDPLIGIETASFLDVKEERESEVEREHFWRNGVAIRRKRRRRRRINLLECMNIDDDDDYQNHKFLFSDKNSGKSRFMNPKEEAKFSWHLQERARIEAVRTEALAKMEEEEHELSSIQWANAAGISQKNLDRIIWNGKQSEKRITKSYLRLVVSVASSYQGKGLSLQDLTQEGSIGLLRGAIKFNPEKGYKLSTYAYWWIRQAITRAITKKSKIIRLPGSIHELVPKICEANAVLSRKLRRFPTYEEIAEEIDANASSVRLAIERNKSPISLDQASTSRGSMSLQVLSIQFRKISSHFFTSGTLMISYSGGARIGPPIPQPRIFFFVNSSFYDVLQAIIPGPDEMTPEAMVKKEALKPEIEKLLEPLCDREAHVLRLHYGLNGGAPRSFEEIGKLLELSRERVRQINSSALSKLREIVEIDDLKYFI